MGCLLVGMVFVIRGSVCGGVLLVRRGTMFLWADDVGEGLGQRYADWYVYFGGG